MEKTIRELAIELNISKEAIYRKINHSMKNELASHIIKKDGKTYISVIGQSIICQSLKREKDEIESEQEQETMVINNVTNIDAVVSNVSPVVTNTDAVVNNVSPVVANIDAVVSNVVSNTECAENLEYIRFLENQIDLLQTRHDLLLTRYDNEVNNNRRERETLYQLNQGLMDTFNREQHLQYADKQLQLQEKQVIRSERVNEPADANLPLKGFFSRIFKKR